jgi:ArsR family transcriptional regulator
MAEERAKERLARLVNAGICSTKDVEECVAQLKAAAEVEMEVVERRSKFFKALADETRLRILKLLELREMCVCEVMVALDLTQPTASYHLGILESAGLVKERKTGKWVFYRIANPELIEDMHRLGLLK